VNESLARSAGLVLVRLILLNQPPLLVEGIFARFQFIHTFYGRTGFNKSWLQKLFESLLARQHPYPQQRDGAAC
jgi:hypothetical protein